MRPRVLRGSIFLKILAVFAGALLVIAGYFWISYLLSDWETELLTAQRSGVNYAEYIVEDLGHPPDTAAARALADRLGVGIRIEGPGMAWATPEGFPRFDEVELLDVPDAEGSRAGLAEDLGFSVDLARDEYRYLFSFQAGRFALDSSSTSDNVIDALFMIAVLLAVYLLIRRLLRPLRTLGEGVSRLREGDLGVEMETRRSDELGRLIVSFNEMAEAVRERVRARDQLLLDVSHELRSPLTRMKVALNMLPDSRAKESILEDIEDTEGMIAGLLETERMDSRYGGLVRSRADIAALLEEIATLHTGSPPGVETEGTGVPVWVEVDVERIRALVGNLVSNAIKYSPDDGRPVMIRLRTAGSALRIEVEDHGVGIDPHDLTHIFEPFFRADRSRSKQTGGYGLGLSLAKRIAEAHGGTIHARSSPGVGTVIVVTLPLRTGEENSDPVQGTAPESAPSGAGRTKGPRRPIVDAGPRDSRPPPLEGVGEADVSRRFS